MQEKTPDNLPEQPKHIGTDPEDGAKEHDSKTPELEMKDEKLWFPMKEGEATEEELRFQNASEPDKDHVVSPVLQPIFENTPMQTTESDDNLFVPLEFEKFTTIKTEVDSFDEENISSSIESPTTNEQRISENSEEGILNSHSTPTLESNNIEPEIAVETNIDATDDIDVIEFDEEVSNPMVNEEESPSVVQSEQTFVADENPFSTEENTEQLITTESHHKSNKEESHFTFEQNRVSSETALDEDEPESSASGFFEQNDAANAPVIDEPVQTSPLFPKEPENTFSNVGNAMGRVPQSNPRGDIDLFSSESDVNTNTNEESDEDQFDDVDPVSDASESTESEQPSDNGRQIKFRTAIIAVLVAVLLAGVGSGVGVYIYQKFSQDRRIAAATAEHKAMISKLESDNAQLKEQITELESDKVELSTTMEQIVKLANDTLDEINGQNTDTTNTTTNTTTKTSK